MRIKDIFNLIADIFNLNIDMFKEIRDICNKLYFMAQLQISLIAF